MANVLLVDDEPDFVAATRELLTMHGHSVDTAERLDDARRILGNDGPEVLLLDLMLPDGNGLELLEELRGSSVKRVVFITGHPGIKSLIKNLSGPSVTYLTKPIDSHDLMSALSDLRISAATPQGDSERELVHFGLLIGESAPMRAVYEQIEKVARTDSPVLDRRRDGHRQGARGRGDSPLERTDGPLRRRELRVAIARSRGQRAVRSRKG